MAMAPMGISDRKKVGKLLSGRQKVAAGWLLFIVGAALLAPWLSAFDPTEPAGQPLLPPNRQHPLGTDYLGRDLLARVAHGGRTSLGASTLAAALTVLLGASAGLLAAGIGGTLDRIVVWLGNVLLAIPGLLLAMLVIASLGAGLPSVVIAVGIGGAPGFARIARTRAQQILEEGYVDAAAALGANALSVLRHHVLPNALRQLAPLATTHLAWAFLGTTTLTFLGLAGDPSIPEWGAVLEASRAHLLQSPWGAIWSALAISLTILAVHALGEEVGK